MKKQILSDVIAGRKDPVAAAVGKLKNRRFGFADLSGIAIPRGSMRGALFPSAPYRKQFWAKPILSRRADKWIRASVRFAWVCLKAVDLCCVPGQLRPIATLVCASILAVDSAFSASEAMAGVSAQLTCPAALLKSY